jgi:membrane-associated protein
MDLWHEFLRLFTELDKALAEIVRDYGAWTYAILFLIVFAETGLVVTPFLPGDSLLFAAGALCAHGDLSVWGLMGLLIVAAILGDTVNYHIGKAIGPAAFSGRFRFLKREHLERTQQFFERHGPKAIVLARFVPIIRTFAPFVAGVGTMRYGRFIVYNVVGGVVWVVLFVGLGYWFGALPFVKAHFSKVILAIIVLSLLPIAWEWWRARREAASARSGPTKDAA